MIWIPTENKFEVGEGSVTISTMYFLNLKCLNYMAFRIVISFFFSFFFSKLYSSVFSWQNKMNGSSNPDGGYSEIQNHCIVEQAIWRNFTLYKAIKWLLSTVILLLPEKKGVISKESLKVNRFCSDASRLA